MNNDIKVPEGFSVQLHQVSPDPAVTRSSSGALLVHLGFGGDDPRELPDLLVSVKRQLQERAPLTRFVSQARKLSDLFTDKFTQAHEHAMVFWTNLGDAVNEAPERLDQCLEVIKGINLHQTLILGGRPSTGRGQLQKLSQHGVQLIVTPAPQSNFLAEVKRPDGVVIVGFTEFEAWSAPLEDKPAKQGGGLFRAPRLRRLLLNVLDKGQQGAWSALHDELLRRQHPLLFFVESNGQLRTMSWPEKPESALPIFSDLRSLLRAASELGRAVGTYGIGSLTADKLIALAKKNKLGLAFNTYDEQGQPHYISLGGPAILALSEGRRP